MTATSTKCPPQCVLYVACPFAMSTIPFLTMPDATILYCAMAFLSEVCQTNFNHGFPVQRSAKVMHEEVIQPINFQTMFVWIRSLRRHHVVNQSTFLAIIVLWDKPQTISFNFFLSQLAMNWSNFLFVDSREVGSIRKRQMQSIQRVRPATARFSVSPPAGAGAGARPHVARQL